jgi:hypothetical protein
MASWRELERDAPEFGARVQRAFSAGTNKVLATLRADGSPRVSGSELAFEGGEVTLGMMPHSRKLDDVLRDGRVAIHSPTIEPPEGSLGDGDAKLAGMLREIQPSEGAIPGTYFALDIREAVITWVERDLLVVESWHPGRGVTRVERT